MLVAGGVVRAMWGQVDVGDGKLTSPFYVDNNLLEFHRVSGCTGWCRELDALVDVICQTTTFVASCAAAISTHSLEARDLWSAVLLAELRFLDQRHSCNTPQHLQAGGIL